MNEDYQKWENDVLSELSTLKAQLDENESAKALYNGFYVWDSKFIENPEIMFIGINPGNGNPFNNRSIEVKPQEQMSFLEYLDGENDSYTLAKETVNVFEKVGFSKDKLKEFLNERTVKTNFYYIITNRGENIKQCIEHLGKGQFGEFWKKSYSWTGKLIKIVNPKIVICEGKHIYETIAELMGEKAEWEKGCGFFKTNNEELIVVGYARHFSRITNPDDLSALLKKFITPLN